MRRIAIIGAGMAGLAAADNLQSSAEVVLFDKTWRAGGRVSTRDNDWSFDHGAQYFTVKSADFYEFLRPFREQGLLEPWHARYAEINRDKVIERSLWNDEKPRYVAVPGMTSLGQAISKRFTVHYETRINRIEAAGNRWRLFADGETIGDFDWVVMAIPSPQVLQLTPESFSQLEAVRQSRMAACYTLMLGFDELTDIGFDAASVLNSDIAWIAANHQKPGRTGKPALLIHASHDWTERHLEMDRETVTEHMTKAAEVAINRSLSTCRHKDLHRWLYADVKNPAGQAALVDHDSQLAAIGDWCISGRVESAFLSGLALAKQLNESH